MKVYIFGAGASLGSQEVSLLEAHQKAPLIDNIFDNQYHRYADDVFVRADLLRDAKASIGDSSLEDWLTSTWDAMGSRKSKESLAYDRRMFGSIALYLWRMMSVISTTYNGNNAYAAFLRNLARNDDESEKAFINFNYDLLLDKALEDIYPYDLSGELNKYTNINYLKPHGSVNWFVPKRVSDPAIAEVDKNKREVVYSRMTNSLFNGEPLKANYTILDPVSSQIQNLDMPIDLFGTGNYGFPLIMLPLSAKMYDLVDGFLGRMHAEIARILPKATEICVIGYKGNDALMKEMLLQAPKDVPIHVVGRGHAADVQAKLIKVVDGRLAKGEIHDEGFRDFVKSM